LRVESPVYIAAEALPDAQSCRVYDAVIRAAGSWPPFSFAVTAAGPPGEAEPAPLPGWLALSADGRLTGVAPTAGTVRVPVTVTDAAGNTCAAALPLAVHATSPDTDGDGDVGSAELLAFRQHFQAGCATGDEWSGALDQWQRTEGVAPEAPTTSLGAGLVPCRVLESPRYLPGGRETIRVVWETAAELAAGPGAVLTEVLPPGWAVAPDGATDATGRVLPGPRREGQTISWLLDEAAVCSGGAAIAVRPSPPVAEPVVLQGWVTLPEGVVPTGGSRLWWARRERRASLVLKRGWNLVSLPLDLPGDGVPEALAGLELRHCQVGNGPQPAVTALASLVAYWVWSPSPMTLVLKGFETTRSAPSTGPGWTPCGVARRLAPAALPGRPRIVWRWGEHGWEPQQGDLLPGRGYLVFVP
jgi:hypothetical protein